MIFDRIENAGSYFGISQNLDTALRFLQTTDLLALPMGKTLIDGSRVFANVMEAATKNEAELSFEIHRRYFDIQVDLSGTECIAFGGRDGRETDPFSAERDIGFVETKESARVTLGPGRFAVCCPLEPHMPGIAAGAPAAIRKLVIKVEA